MTARITRTNPAAMRLIRKRMKQLGKKAAYVGLPSSTDGDLLMRGAVHNFGSVSQNIPARPWLTEGVNEGVDKYQQVARNKVPRVMDGTMTIQTYYNLLGEIGKSEIQKYIRNGDFTPLADSTIEAKGSSKPLIDTGQMRNAVTYEVK